MIIADDADDDDSDLPAYSGPEIESESESEYTDSDTTDEEELADNVFNDGMVACRGLRTGGGYRRPKAELIRKRPNSPNMKDGEWRPVLKQVWQDDDSGPDMDEPLATMANSNKKKVSIVWSGEAKDPPNFPFNENSGFLIDIPENAGPIYFLKMFLSDDLNSFLVVETNRYAEKVLDEIIIKRILGSKSGNQQISMKWNSFLAYLYIWECSICNVYVTTGQRIACLTPTPGEKQWVEIDFFYSYNFSILRYHVQTNGSARFHFSWII